MTPESQVSAEAGQSAARSFGRKLVMLAFVAGFSFVAALLAAEVFLRLFVPVTDVAFQFWDPVVGLRRFPNQNGRNLAGNYVKGAYRFNSAGWNYPREFEVARPPGTLRIVLIGDSYVEAMQVPCEKQMAVATEEALIRAGRPAQCYPMGCSGLGTAQEYQILRHYALDYKPDVVLFFFTQNDVYDCSPYLRPIEAAIPAYALGPSGDLEFMPATGWQPSLARRLSAKTALARYFLIQKRLLQAGAPRGPAGVTLRESSGAGKSPRFRGGDLSEADRGKKSWELIEALLAASKAECERNGALFGVVFRGSVPEIDSVTGRTPYEPPAREKDPYCMRERIHEMGRDFVGPICEKLGIPYLDLTDALKAKVSQTGLPHDFPDDDHYNESAHAAAGDAIAKWVSTLRGAAH